MLWPSKRIDSCDLVVNNDHINWRDLNNFLVFQMDLFLLIGVK